MVSSPISVVPIYGWGWTDGKVTIETPSEFVAVVEQKADGLSGVVQSGDLAGRKIEMSKRHAGPFDGMVNITIRNDELDEKLSGFAEISRDLME